MALLLFLEDITTIHKPNFKNNTKRIKMLRNIFISLTLTSLVLNAYSIPELFDALKQNPNTILDEISVKKSQIEKDKVYATLYPKINLFAKYNHFSEPTGIVPVPPNTLTRMVKDPNVAQPFGKNVYGVGASFTMPLFVKSIYTLVKQTKMMNKSSQKNKQLNLLRNEALLVGTNATLQYLEALKKSLESKNHSLNETYKFIKIKVASGRAAESELYKIQDALNSVKINLNNIEITKQKAYSSVESLTSIRLDKPVDMEQISTYKEGDFQILEPLKLKSLALSYGVKAQKEKIYWPNLSSNGKYNKSNTDAYNNGESITEDYSQVGVTLSIPLLNMDNYARVDEAKIEAMKIKTQLDKESVSLKAQTNALKNSLNLIENSTFLYKKSVENKQKLLNIAKISFKNGRMSMEEYLRYEDELVAQEAKLYESFMLKWQTLMKLAVIYANDIEEIVR